LESGPRPAEERKSWLSETVPVPMPPTLLLIV
jgi:hypothetical protein